MATLHLEQHHTRWDVRRELVLDQRAARQPDAVALHALCWSLQTGRWLRRTARERLGGPVALGPQSTGHGSFLIDGEALWTRYPVVETAHGDARTLAMVAPVVRLDSEGQVRHVYGTHRYRSRGDAALRRYQVQPLLAWIQTRDDVEARVVCGDFNATLEMPSAQLMASVFRPTQTAPTAFTPLQDTDGSVSHPYGPRVDRGIDSLWVAGPLAVHASGVCVNTPSPPDPTWWPSDHAGVWADLTFV